MQGPWLKSHPKLQPWYFIQGLGQCCYQVIVQTLQQSPRMQKTYFVRPAQLQSAQTSLPHVTGKHYSSEETAQSELQKRRQLPAELGCLSSRMNIPIMGYYILGEEWVEVR